MDAFWTTKKLSELTFQEWERVCDGCSRCCLVKMEDERTGQLYHTRIVCRYMDMVSCRCTCYDQRARLVPTCVRLSPDTLAEVYFMPRTCAYRLLAEGRELYWWHPLLSGDPDSVHRAGISVRGKVVSEEHVHPDGWQEHVVAWADDEGEWSKSKVPKVPKVPKD